jgi:hypothetical protein
MSQLERAKNKECDNNNDVKNQEACKKNNPGWYSIHNYPLAKSSIIPNNYGVIGNKYKFNLTRFLP